MERKSTSVNGKKVIEDFQKILHMDFHRAPKDATVIQVYQALSRAVMSSLTPKWEKSLATHHDGRCAYYFSAEFLIGRVIYNNLLCLGIYDEVQEQLEQLGVPLGCLEEIEDAALGNGGLGRLAACFLDSAATMNLPLDGYGIRYQYGLFKQEIRDGFQVELPDDWMKYGDPWSLRSEENQVIVTFADQKVIAVPYDTPVIGYGTNHVGSLRLWQAEPINRFDFIAFNNGEYQKAVAERDMAEDISRVLYPNDNTTSGRRLRLKQQYFFCSASLQDMLRKFVERYGEDWEKFPRYHVIQLNDTHPVISIAELLRLLIDEHDVDFLEAFRIARDTFAYTNHTIMAEALEQWSKEDLTAVVPRIFELIEQVDAQMQQELQQKKVDQDVISRLRLIQNDRVQMANLAVYGSSYVNGVAKIHTGLLKTTVLKDWYSVYPDRFQNKTNGITQRRWLALCNRELSALLTRLLGDNSWVTDLSQLKKLEHYADDPEIMKEFLAIKKIKREQLVSYAWEHDGLSISPDTIFDVQVKRLHEYKRQFLNILTILHLYYEIKDGNLTDFTPSTFLFGAKAAPGYLRAKGIIKLINEVAKLIDCDPDVAPYIKVVFLPNYNVSYAEKIIAAADVSEQISTAGTEASGTSNMKFMINGAVTLGTYDGANIEIVDAAGRENNYIFGKTVEEIADLKATYSPRKLYEENPAIRRVLDALTDGTLSDNGSGIFAELKSSILDGASWHEPDHYYLLADFEDYLAKRLQVNRDYQDRISFAQKCWHNLCNGGNFSSDRTIADYAENIWKIKPVVIENQ